ncbi:MAG: hypothetical protein ACK56I_18565, partial [bacterium]
PTGAVSSRHAFVSCFNLMLKPPHPHFHVHERVGLAEIFLPQDHGTTAIPAANPATNAPIC